VSGIPYWPARDPIEEEGGLNLYGFLWNEPMGWIDLWGREPIRPSANDGWELDDDNRWSMPSDIFYEKYMTERERKVGDKKVDVIEDNQKGHKRWYEFGCIGVTHCMLEKTSPYYTQCYLENENKAVSEARKISCKSGEKGSVFAIRYYDKDKDHRNEKKGGKNPGVYEVVESSVRAGLPADKEHPDGHIPFDFGYRQSDGSYIHANHAAPFMNVKISPSAKQFAKDYHGFNTTVYCVRCSPCTR
jgi:hypothetical protein